MSALHWICAVTLALVCCLSAQPVKRNDDTKEDLLKTLDTLTGIAENCSSDSKLYSPYNIREDCLSSAMNCNIKELKMFAIECKPEVDEEDFEVFNNLLTGLSREDWKFSPGQSSNCTCEKLYEETDVKTFLGNIKTLMQRLWSSEG